MNSMVDEVAAIGRPKYHDFKVYFDIRHKAAGSTRPSTYDINGAGFANTADDWDYSRYVSADDDQDAIADADQFTAHMIGVHSGTPSNWDSIGLIKSYGESRVTVPNEQPTSGQVVSSDPLINIFDFSSEEQMNEIVDILNFDNDNAPYNHDTYLGEAQASMQHVARIGTEVGIGRVGRASGFVAPIGLICVDPLGVSTPFRVVLNLAPGTYHGVYAERA